RLNSGLAGGEGFVGERLGVFVHLRRPARELGLLLVVPFGLVLGELLGRLRLLLLLLGRLRSRRLRSRRRSGRSHRCRRRHRFGRWGSGRRRLASTREERGDEKSGERFAQHGPLATAPWLDSQVPEVTTVLVHCVRDERRDGLGEAFRLVLWDEDVRVF